MQISTHEAHAIEQFVLNVTIPIFVDADESAILLATGTLFKLSGRHFLITARHIFDDVADFSSLVFSSDPVSGDLHTFGRHTVLRPKDDHIDVAAVELKDSETVSRLEENWQFLSLENVGAASPKTDDSAVFVSGYPTELTKKNAELIHGRFITDNKQRLPDPPDEAKKPVIPELDLFYDYSYDAISVRGDEVKTPKLPGVSGASVWELRPISGIWSPEAAIRVVGIQSAYLHSKYIRAKNWWAVAKVLEQSDPQLAELVEDTIKRI